VPGTDRTKLRRGLVALGALPDERAEHRHQSDEFSGSQEHNGHVRVFVRRITALDSGFHQVSGEIADIMCR